MTGVGIQRLALVAAAAALVGGFATGVAQGHKNGENGDSRPLASKVILFSSDGMRPDLVDRYAKAGAMPTMRTLLKSGVRGVNGLVQAFPPNTGVGWSTLASGTWSSEHGSTNNTFFRTGESNFNNSTGIGAPGAIQTDSIQQSAERAGKIVVSMEWVASRALNPAMRGPVVDFRGFFSNRGIVANYDVPGQPAGAAAFGVSYQRTGTTENAGTSNAYDVPAVTNAEGWTNVPATRGTPQQAQFRVRSTAFPSDANVNRFYDLYIYDSAGSAPGFDHVLVVPSTAGKDGSQAVANLEQNQWADVKVKLVGSRAGQTAGFYVKAIEVAPDLAKFRLYFTSIARSNATYNGCTYAPGCNTALGFEETLNKDFPTSTAADFAPLEARIVDEDTYVEQGLKWKDAHFAYLRYIIDTLGVRPDLLMLGNPVTDEFSHQFMALVTPTDIDGDPNPYYDDVEGDSVKDNRVAAREGYIRSAYAEADETLTLARSLLGTGTTSFVTSDHGFAPQWRAVNSSKILVDLKLQEREQSGNCRRAANDPGTTTPGDTQVKECHAGGTVQFYINLAGRDPAGTNNSNGPQVPANQYETVRNLIVNEFRDLTDPANPGKKVVDAVYKKEELRNVDGSDSLHPNRSGDVVVAFRPPYQSDGAAPGQRFSFSEFFGQHGYLPNLVNLERNVNMHATFIASGPGIRKEGKVRGVRAIDVAPTISFLMNINAPNNSRGEILFNAVERGGRFREITFLNISDYHGQLPPLTEAADFTVSGTPPVLSTLGPTFNISGAAFLKPWFDSYRVPARHGSLTVTGGDAVGATPPVSNFFGDKPTIDIMNMMGFSADGLGNHNFDRGQTYLRRELIPRARFEYLSANVVDSAGRTPPEWSPSHVFRFRGMKVGVIGFSNTDIATLTKPGSLGPFEVRDPVAAVNAEADRLRAAGVDVIVAMGHLGADNGTARRLEPYFAVGSPSGPLIDLADRVRGVDAVIGDHTNFQVLDTRPNGVLVTENLSRGIRFTRVVLVVDTRTGRVTYKSADWHRSWDIGVTPDPTIQAKIDELNAEIRPIMEQKVGDSTVEILRSDSCGRSDSRLCESKVGNTVTDSMRATYGTDFAITNSGGLRDRLTCPVTDNANDFCPPYTPPPYLITRGQVFSVLPFGNVVATVTVTGAELKAFLENGVSRMPNADGRFPQVSGLCFTYDISAAAQSRVVSAVRQAADGSCTGAPVPLTAANTYSIAINDFMQSGGDGYPAVGGRATSRELMDEVLANWIAANTPISPAIQGRINCTKVLDPASTNNCPPITAP